MKYLPLYALMALAAIAPNAAHAQEGFSVTITVDENCNDTFTNSTGFFSTLPCGLLADPGPGGLSSALTYGLANPPGLVAGDLLLQESGSEAASDIIRFNPNENGGSLVFYSDLDDTPVALADTGLPQALYTNLLRVLETDLGNGVNGFIYTPGAGQPGFVAGAGGPVTYVIESDGSTVPEPASAALMLGAGIFVIRRYLVRR